MGIVILDVLVVVAQKVKLVSFNDFCLAREEDRKLPYWPRLVAENLDLCFKVVCDKKMLRN